MMGWVCSASFRRNLEMAVKRPIRRWTSLILLGLHISMIAVHFSGFASISRCVNMKPKNLPRSNRRRIFQG